MGAVNDGSLFSYLLPLVLLDATYATFIGDADPEAVITLKIPRGHWVQAGRPTTIEFSPARSSSRMPISSAT